MKCMQNVLLLYIITVLALLGIGLVTVYSATCESSGPDIMFKQAIWMGSGILLAIILTFIPLKWYMRMSCIVLVGSGLLLLYLAVASVLHHVNPDLVKYMWGVMEIKGAFRWVKFPGLGSLQPSEFAKFSLLLFLSTYYGIRTKQQIRKGVEGFLIPLACAGSIVLLVLLGKDLGTGLIMGAVVGAIMFYAGVSWKHLLSLVAMGILAFCLMVMASPERLSRLTAFGKSSELRSGDGYQLYQSQMALGGGGAMGRGFTRSIMKTGFLPAHDTDFILAVWGEEMGFVGMLIVLLLYMALMTELIIGAAFCHDNIGVLICLGVCTLVTTQAIVNIGVVTGGFPTTGVTAPFMSYGGSSILSLLMCVGLASNVFLRNLKYLNEAASRGNSLPTHEEMRRAAEVRLYEK